MVGAESRADKEAIEQSSTRAGWELNGSFSEYLTIGFNSDSLSILAYAQAREPEDSLDGCRTTARTRPGRPRRSK